MSDDSLDILARALALVAERNLSDAERFALVSQLRTVAELHAHDGFSRNVAKDCRRLADQLTKSKRR